MNTASRELCEELYKLTGWGKSISPHIMQTSYSWFIYEDRSNVDNPSLLPSHQTREYMLSFDGKHSLTPAYDMGYIVRKLQENKLYPIIELGMHGRWWAKFGYKIKDGSIIKPAALAETEKTPEDALCKLAISLAKAGLLTNQEEV